MKKDEAQRWNFHVMEPFSKDAYRSLLALALREGYSCASFLEPGEAPGSRLFLRHDIDYSLQMAVELAEKIGRAHV